MGFTPWTLWGMGISAAGAIIALVLSLLAQSPLALKRIGLGSSNLDQRARSFTTYAIASMILGLGFFLAGVPIGDADQTAVQTTTPVETQSTAVAGSQSEENTNNAAESTPPLTPETGAFGGPPPGASSTETVSDSTNISTTASLTGTISPESTIPVEDATPTSEPTPTIPATASPEPTETPTPTATPLPTLTPTPITGVTATIDIGGGNVWLLRSPGGQNLVILSNGDTVLLRNGKANQAGVLWQEIMTVNGVLGWVQESYLNYNDETE